jgi:acetyl-CoA carboxylase biotin carboxyl carrier protein
MDIRKIRKLIELLEESGLAELEISEGEESVRIARFGKAVNAIPQGASQPMLLQAAPAQPGAPPAPVPAERRDENLVTAPMVGTFYGSPAPGAKPFVQIGQEVRVGEVLCIIEAMKMMNQIESERTGKVVAVLAKDGEPVEFGQPLFEIE